MCFIRSLYLYCNYYIFTKSSHLHWTLLLDYCVCMRDDSILQNININFLKTCLGAKMERGLHEFILHIFDKSYTFMNYGSIFFSDILLSYTKFSFSAIFVNKRNNKWRMIPPLVQLSKCTTVQEWNMQSVCAFWPRYLNYPFR